MKCFKILLLPLSLFFITNSSAQENQDQAIDTAVYKDDVYLDYRNQDAFRLLDNTTTTLGFGVYLASMPFISQQSFGGGLDFQAKYTNNLSAGLSFTITSRKVDSTFGYNIGESLLMYYDLSLYNELQVLQWKRLKAAIRLNTGFAVFHLADNSIQEKYVWYDEYGIPYEGERALSIANNNFFKVAPAFSLKYEIAYHVAIEANATYNFYIGNAKYGERSDFNNYMLQFGMKFDLN
ncbi:MAG: hypothetical protein WC756_16155 [Taibaiella sp.]|jgi:hypothetical protein